MAQLNCNFMFGFKMRRTCTLTCLFLLDILFFGTEISGAQPIDLIVKSGEPNLVTFTSIAPLETIVGKTSAISGSISFDPSDLNAPVSGALEVEMATLETGNRIRDGHMRSNHLEIDSYPISRFSLKSLNGTLANQLKDGVISRFKAHGTFLCHGVTRDIEPEVIATWNGSRKELSVEALFSVKLSDYNIARPQFLVMKLDETQAISVKFVAVQSASK